MKLSKTGFQHVTANQSVLAMSANETYPTTNSLSLAWKRHSYDERAVVNKHNIRQQQCSS
jgi:hypothetical protein